MQIMDHAIIAVVPSLKTKSASKPSFFTIPSLSLPCASVVEYPTAFAWSDPLSHFRKNARFYHRSCLHPDCLLEREHPRHGLCIWCHYPIWYEYERPTWEEYEEWCIWRLKLACLS